MNFYECVHCGESFKGEPAEYLYNPIEGLLPVCSACFMEATETQYLRLLAHAHGG